MKTRFLLAMSFVLAIFLAGNVYAYVGDNPFGVQDPPDNDACAVQGWTCDPNDWVKQLTVNFYTDSNLNPNSFIGTTIADQFFDTGVARECGGYEVAHRFKYFLPPSYKDGKPHDIYALAKNAGNKGMDQILGNTGGDTGKKTITCSTPTPTPTPTPTSTSTPTPTPTSTSTPTPTPTSTSTITLSGRVTSSNGTGIAGVVINQGYDTNPGPPACFIGTATTDKDGNFSFPNIPAGKLFCLRGPAAGLPGYRGGVPRPGYSGSDASYECQVAGRKADPDGCGGTPGTDKEADNAYNLVYTPANSPVCTISGPGSIARGDKATFTATAPGNSRIKMMEIYYNFNDKSVGRDYIKVATCNTDIVGLSGGCKGEVDTSTIPADKGGFTALCNGYAWKPREDGKNNCNPGNNDPIHCQPEDVDMRADSCSGNPLWNTDRDFGWSGCGSNSHQEVAITAPAVKTAWYRVSTTQFGKNDTAPDWKRYTADPMPESLTFTNAVQGQDLTVFVQFKDTAGNLVSDVISKSIKYTGPDPDVSNAVCSYSPAGDGTQIVINGTYLGDQGKNGKVRFNDKDAQIISWNRVASEASASARVDSNSFRVIAKIRDKLAGSAVIPWQLFTDNNRPVPGNVSSCIIDLTTVSFNARAGCRPPGNFANTDVRVQITEKADNARPVYNEKISLDTDGHPIWNPPALEVGKTYALVIRAPKSLGYKKEFTVSAGVNILDDFNLLVGDIYGQGGQPDNVINAFDTSELLREWNIINNISRPGDLNGDSRVNSVDYACMRQNYNKTGEQ